MGDSGGSGNVAAGAAASAALTMAMASSVDDDAGFFYYHDYTETIYNGGRQAGRLLGLQGLGDEWQALGVQGRRGTILRAARLGILRSTMVRECVRQLDEEMNKSVGE